MAKEPTSDRIDDEGATMILERAAQLDAGRGRWIALSELREAALEAGISASAFERAISEVDALRTKLEPILPGAPPAFSEQAEPVPGGWRAWVRPALMASLGAALGLLAAFLDGAVGLDGDASLVFSFVLAFQVALYLVVRHRRRGTLLEFQVDLAGLWAGLTFMLMTIMAPYGSDDVAFAMAFVWAVAAVVGAVLVKLKLPWRSSEG